MSLPQDTLSDNVRFLAAIMRCVQASGSGTTNSIVSEVSQSELFKSIDASKIRNELLRLSNFGFLNREIKDRDHPLTSSLWALTLEGRNFLEFVQSLPCSQVVVTPLATSTFDTKLIVTVPPRLRELLTRFGDSVISTRDILEILLSESKNLVRIVSPYFDESVGYLMDTIKPNVTVAILTSISEDETDYVAGARKRLLVKLRQRVGNLECRSFSGFERGVQLYISHAKIYVGDDRCLLITSANLKQSSLIDNFEMGIYTESTKMVRIASEIFDEIWKEACEVTF